MRDIRADLKERLENIEAERIKLKKQLESLDCRETAIRDLLADEIARMGNDQPQLFTRPRLAHEHEGESENGASPVSKFILETLAEGRPRFLTELKNLAERKGLLADSPSPGRSLNFALVGLQRHGYVDRLATGEAAGAWILARPDTSQSEAASDETGASADTEAPETGEPPIV